MPESLPKARGAQGGAHAAAPHSVTLENCAQLTATGILSIVSYDAAGAALETPCGTLVVGGRDLCVSELSVQTGEVKISGVIEFIQYPAPKAQRGGLLARLAR